MSTAAPLPDLEELWTVADVMRFTRMKRTWVYGQVSAGKIPHLKLSPGCLRFIKSEVIAWAAKTSTARQPAPVVPIR